MKQLVRMACVRVALVTGITTLLLASLPHATVSAINFFGDSCQGATSDAAACSGSGDTITGTNGVILRAASLLAIVAGIAAVVAIIISAIMFITAGGDSSRIGNAKKVIIYAIVGLVVIVLARTIVIFVVQNV